MAIAGAVSCAGDKGDVNRVQPGYVAKAPLAGSKWFYRRTVVDAPETMGAYMSIGSGDLFTIERIRWDIQEKYLFAYRDYEYIPGSDNGDYPGADYYGTPIAAFPITSHFDIQREYNPATGEETNVISENSSDRQWFERDYMRVDWSRNANTNIDWFIIPVDQLDTHSTQNGEFYVHEDDATNPFRARIEPQNGYMDFVVDHYVWPDPATCYYEYDFDISDAYNCGAGEIRVRHAFVKVDEAAEATYQPLYYPDSVTLKDAAGEEIADPQTGEVARENIFERFGYYRLDRLTWDDYRGLTESGRMYRIIRFDIWNRSVDEAGNTIPFANRTVKPIVYYMNWDFPAELRETAFSLASEWNRQFQCTVANLQNHSCAAQVCDLAKPFDNSSCKLPDVFVMRDNSCSATTLNNYFAGHSDVLAVAEASMQAQWPGADAVDLKLLDNWCASAEYGSRDLADRFTWEQAGDPRFNMLNYITAITPSGWSGYGPMLGDPITGRTVCATANIMGWTIESAVSRITEYVDYMNGDVTLTDLLNGADLPIYLNGSHYDPNAITLGTADAYAMAKGYGSDELRGQALERIKALGSTPAERLTPVENGAYPEERMARMLESELLKEGLVQPEDLFMASEGKWLPGQEVPEELWTKAFYPTRVREVDARRARTNKLLQESTYCEPMAELDGALVGLSKRLKDLSHDERRLEIKKALFRAVTLHELGHNVGLRHNFQGSFDALNYPKRYWDLEESDFSEQERLEASQPEFTYSSIMDYHGKVNGDFQGLGYWDQAAVAFGYGQLVSTFTDSAVPAGNNLKSFIKYNDYTKLPAHMSGTDCAAITDSTQRATCRTAALSKMYDRSYVSWDWNTVQKQSDVNATLAHEVPLMFCSDEYNGVYPNCKTFDWGANYRELQAADYVNFKNYFLFSHYLKNRLVLDWDRALMRGQLAFNNILKTYQWMYLYASKDPDGFGATDLYKDMYTATTRGLNMMSEVLAMPQPSRYYRCERDDGVNPVDVTYRTNSIKFEPLVDITVGYGPDHDPANGVTEICNMDAILDVKLGDGYPLFIALSEDYLTYTFLYLGTYFDKLAAIDTMTYPIAWFPRENQDEDLGSYYSMSLYRMFPEEMNDLLSRLIQHDSRGLGSSYSETEGCIAARKMIYDAADTGHNSCGSADTKIAATLAFNMQIETLLYGQAFLTSPFDATLDFGKHARVALKGASDDFTAFDDVAPADRAECTLPEGGRTYRAMRTNGVTGGVDIAFDFVNRCSWLVVQMQTAKTAYDAAMAAVAGTSPQDPTYNDLVIAEQDRRLEWETAEANMRETEQMLRFMRQVNQVYEYGVF